MCNTGCMALHQGGHTAEHVPSPLTVAAGLFAGAEVLLVTSEGTLGERIHGAYAGLAQAAVGYAPSLPAPIGLAVTDLHASMTGGCDPGEGDAAGAVARTLATMSATELRRVALAICTIADFLRQALDDERARHLGRRTACRYCDTGQRS